MGWGSIYYRRLKVFTMLSAKGSSGQANLRGLLYGERLISAMPSVLSV
ncbi:hypothetical protein SLEP1_g45780 [Rubroshorea leprosula]|uniref:Uncharacterized protein n=1 Tax=Rubroshorea leprosula TaxID=152421 RepID=A0AAV5LLX4_9ROSI|nr:hypothetical protein SLEP1_g45780 [Rubroshorea leprosula]